MRDQEKSLFERKIAISPEKEKIIASPGETITRKTTIKNISRKEITDLDFSISPYSYTLDENYTITENFDEPWSHYNKATSWIKVNGIEKKRGSIIKKYNGTEEGSEQKEEQKNVLTVLAPDESIDITYEITIPSCSPSDYQWAAIEYITYESLSTWLGRCPVSTPEIIELEIKNNNSTECGGTADDQYPYVEIKYIDEKGVVNTTTVPYNSSAAKLYKEEKSAIEQYEIENSTNNQNLPVIIALSIGLIAITALLFLLFKKHKIKNHLNSKTKQK